ncbi:MAG: ABC transporter permease [Rubellimicrobium sp.]|nr:ABC transporter permease [Rubellimicrobium sp.]
MRLWRRAPWAMRVGAGILALHLAAALFGPALAGWGPAQMGAGPPLSGPSWAHPFGIDQLGRDVFSRVLHGARVVLVLSLSGTALGVAVGAVIGLLSGLAGGWIDDLVQRALEILISIPFLVLALIAMVAVGPILSGQPVTVIGVVALIYAPRVARIARAAAQEIATRDFVTMARLRGDGALTIMWREILPNARGVLLVEFSLRASYAPVLIGSLGFLGFGLRPPPPEWGLMMAENRALLIVTPWAVLGPGLALSSLVVGLNLFTDGLARMLGRHADFGAAG